MPTTTTTYSFNKPVVGADEDDWGGYLNGNWDSVDDLLDGTTPVTGIDINSGTLDGVTIGGTTAGAGTFTTLTANTSITGTLATAAQTNVTSLGTLTGLTIGGNLSVDGGTIKLDGNYPVGLQNVALGDVALGALQSGGNYNTGIGYDALGDLTTGDHNTGIGREALRQTTTASENTGIGSGALVNNTTGGLNTAVGRQALFQNTTASNNTAVGYQAGYANTTGTLNTFVGKEASRLNTTGNSNTSMGYQALEDTTTGSSNTAIGLQALNKNTTASNNTAVGYKAGYSQTSASNYATYVGSLAGENTTGTGNTFVGANAGNGDGAGRLVTTGAKNTILGGYNGNQGGLDIRTSSNNIVLSDGDGNPRGIFTSNGIFLVGTTAASGFPFSTPKIYVDNSSGFNGVGCKNIGSGFIAFTTQPSGNHSYYGAYYLNSSNTAVGSISVGTSSTAYNTTSDYRLKENVVDLTGATDRLKQLEPKRFNFIADADTTVDGFLAHEVQSVVPEAITGTHNEVDAEGNPVYQGIDQSKLVPLLVATIKELEARITALENA